MAPAEQPPVSKLSGAASLTEFGFYFQHLAALDAAADKADAEETPGADTDVWRRYEQEAAGLNDREAAILKDVAYRCNQAFRDREIAPEPRPGTLEILSAAVEELRTHLALEAFESLARRIEGFIRPGVVEVPAAQASGTEEEAEEEELPVEVEPQALPEVMQVLSLTWMLQDGFFVAECATARQGAITDQKYIAGVSSCFLYGTALPPIPLGCAGNDGLCMQTFPPAPPGHQRWTQATHYLRMYFSENCLGTGVPGLEDPLRYCGRNPLPSIVDIADIPPLGGAPACWGGYPQTDLCPLALSRAFPVTYLDIIPRQATVNAGGEFQFATPNNMLATWSLNGPGTISDLGLYKAPASVESQQTATITACDVYAPSYCVTATVTVTPLRVDVVAQDFEVLPSGKTTLTATVIPAAQGQEFEWTISPAVGTLTASGNSATYNAPKNDDLSGTFEITVKACLKPAGTVCGTARVLVPKIFIDFIANPPTHSLPPGGTIQFTAIVGGSTAPRELQWEQYPEIFDARLTVDTPDTLVATYKASAFERTTVLIRACLKNTVEDLCSENYSLQILDPFLVNPKTATVGPGQTQQFTTPDPAVTWSIAPATPDAGSITQSGLYTAPAILGSVSAVTVTATSQADATRKDTATVTLQPPVGLVVVVSPKTFSLTPGQTQQFTATVSNSTNTAVTWSIQPATGTISPSGLYTAPTPFGGPATVTVTATSQEDPSKKDTATVTLVPAPLTLTSTPSPAWVNHGTTITWTATASGGTPGTIQYAFFRKKAGTTIWIPAQTSPAWQTSNIVSWIPGPADVGTWDIQIWARDVNTPPGSAVIHNPGPVEVVAPLTAICPTSPASANYGTPITWTVTTSGGTPPIHFALFRRRAGTTTWTPAVTTPAWQTNNVLSWTPAAGDVGTWEFYIWIKDARTPPTMNGYGYAIGCNAGTVQILALLTLTSTPSPASVNYGTAITWTATASGGTGTGRQYALVRKKVGTTTWTSPVWQTSNVLTWTPSSADLATWDILLWVRDSATPAGSNGASYNPGSVQVLAPLSLTGTGSPAYATSGTAITWTATASGGTGVGRQFAFFRKRAGASTWTPSVSSPAWQASNAMSWTPTSADVGTWETYIWVKDSATPPTMNTYGYAASYNPGPVQIVAPLGLTCTSSPPLATYGSDIITWTANATGGVPSSTQFALFRKKVGTTNWIPALTAPAWQTPNLLSWGPSSADLGTWEIRLWVRDGNTPPTMNTYGYAASCNPGNVQVVAPLTVTGTGSPPSVYHGNPITWTATGSGGTGVGRMYAFFRKKVGTTNWIPAVNTPAWQSSNVMSWTPASADIGTWETSIWFKDANTPANANTYGYGAYYNPGPVQVVGPLTVSCGNPPVSATYGTPVIWSAYAGGGYTPTIRYAFFRRRVGTSTWTPAVTSPAWQAGNSFTWTPTSGEVGTWETYVWVRDANTPANMNTYGYAAGCNSGTVQVVAPLSLTGTYSPSSADCGSTITWTAYASGGYPPTRKYALFRRRAGTSSWIPAVTSPAWQSSRVLSWTPSCSDVGTWEIYIWVKDSNTPANMNTYGYAAGYNAGPVQVIEPVYQYSDPIGWVDGYDSLHVWGWACDPDYPWESNRVDLWTTSWQWIGSADAAIGSSAPINSACGGGWAHYFDFYHWGAIPSGTHFWVWSIDLPYSTPGGVNVPIGGTSGGNEFVMP